MPTDHLTTVAPSRLAEAVLDVLSGTPAAVAAVAINIHPDDLTDAIEVYQTAGREALEAHAGDHAWYHVNVQFSDSDAVEQTVAGPLHENLDRLRERETVDAWWFMRKPPGWRLRLRSRGGAVTEEMKAAVNAVLNDLANSGVIERWWPGIYEPENVAFGGLLGMRIAHNLFCADSRRILTYLRQPAPDVGRKELSMLLCSIMLSAAGLDMFERGDVWHRVAEWRPLPDPPPSERVDALADKIRSLVSAPLDSTTPSGPLAFAEPWAIDFRRAGESLREAASAPSLPKWTEVANRYETLY